MLKNILILLLGISLFVGCQQGREGDMALAEVSGVSSAAEVAPQAAYAAVNAEQKAARDGADMLQQGEENPVGDVNKKIVRSGQMTLESKDSKASKVAIDQRLKKLGGYYEEEKISAGDSYTNYSPIVRVPVKSFDAFIAGLEEGKDKVTSKTVNAEDVSLQYYDLESRLKSKRAYLLRYQEMVAKAKSVSDLLEIEEQIRKLQEEIDSHGAVLRSLSGQVSFSTLRLEIYDYDSTLATGGTTFGKRIAEAFVLGWALIKQILLGLVAIWPLLLVGVAFLVIWRRYRRRKKNL